jgi:hypothetical protein
MSALDVAGAFSNDGYKMRDSFWGGKLKPSQSQILSVNLYAGNHYYFILAGEGSAKKMSVQVYDELGRPVLESLPFQHSERAVSAVGISPVWSGQYLVKVQLLEARPEKPAEFCLMYTYK